MINQIANLMTAPLADLTSAGGDLANYAFFSTLNEFLGNEIDYMQWRLLSSSAYIIGVVAVVVLTVWIMWQGFRIVTGQSRQPMMALVGDSAKAVLIVFIATTAAYASSSVYWSLSDGVSSTIASYVTSSGQSPFESIDDNLRQMEVAMALIDSVDTGDKTAAQEDKDRNRWFTGIGVAGPSVVAGCMLLLNKIALALFIGFGPFFIMCLLFDSTKQLFQKWLLYGIGTMFSLAVLSVMVTIAMKMMKAITIAYAAKYLTSMGLNQGTVTDGINSMAMQQGGIGLLLSTLIVMAPPMAASFFQGTLGQFASYSSFGSVGSQIGAQDAQARSQGRPSGTYTPPPSQAELHGASPPAATPVLSAFGPSGSTPQTDTVKTART
ncbi:type IV secretion system protein [Luteibacter sp. PPL201]|uniref:Type IV secretion system protein n=1 Tax=Luteibacter sahnii TaxID=3021977 RepID=A0ABT6B7I4_9GAMM|nr:type IV secretion system protein [Luteibacter sp. PPL193]MDY1548005.1 type IV secretion system protein [Luteibacter sp. PPL193]